MRRVGGAGIGGEEAVVPKVKLLARAAGVLAGLGIVVVVVSTAHHLPAAGVGSCRASLPVGIVLLVLGAGLGIAAFVHYRRQRRDFR